MMKDRHSVNPYRTAQFELQLPGMHQRETFVTVFLPNSPVAVLQGAHYVGTLNIKTGRGKMSTPHPEGARPAHLKTDTLTRFQVGQDSLNALLTVLLRDPQPLPAST